MSHFRSLDRVARRAGTRARLVRSLEWQPGFTLIELIIAMMAIGILTAIAYPSYTKYVSRGRRVDATATLMQDAQILERCYTQYFAYNSANCPTLSTTSPLGYYKISLTATASTYTLSATPVSGGAQASDSACTAFSINNTGGRCSTGTSGNNNCSADTLGGNCWNGRS
ncbi:MAG: type IV pilin protein [Nevskiaceae bacterium]|nr:MAG: type IV pilin protein [Nevskiaceae bacterium]